jgi:hypothetical protein
MQTFGGVSDVVEIAGGRVAFADPMARRFHTGDFATVRSTPSAFRLTPALQCTGLLYRHPGG